MSRIILGKTAQRALGALFVHGPLPLSHGARYAEISAGGIRVMQSTNHLLRTSGMVEWAGGNFDRWTVRITPYGDECRRRGWRDSGVTVRFADTFGPNTGREGL